MSISSKYSREKIEAALKKYTETDDPTEIEQLVDDNNDELDHEVDNIIMKKYKLLDDGKSDEVGVDDKSDESDGDESNSGESDGDESDGDESNSDGSNSDESNHDSSKDVEETTVIKDEDIITKDKPEVLTESSTTESSITEPSITESPTTESPTTESTHIELTPTESPPPSSPKPKTYIKMAPKHNTSKPITKKDIEKRKQQIITDITEQVRKLEKKETENIDFDDYTTKSKHYILYLNSLFERVKNIGNIDKPMSEEKFVRSITSYHDYTPFGTTTTTLMHTIPQRIISLKYLNDVFNYTFIDTSKYNRNYHLNDLEGVFMKFFESRNKFLSLAIEYKIIVNFLQRLMILLCTYEEIPFTNALDSKPTPQFKIVIDKAFEMIRIINPESRIYRSWDRFVSALFDTTSKMKVFKFKSYAELEKVFDDAYNHDGSYIIEQTLGNTLKTCVWSVSLSYLYAIRSVYVFCRLFSIYYQEGRHKGHDKNKIIKDIYHMALISVSLYEAQWSSMATIAKTFPTLKDIDESGTNVELNDHTKEYLSNHSINSGVYYVLKMFEKAIPIISNQIQC